MTQHEGFTIEIICHDGEWWRYNVAVTCGCFDREGRRIGFASTESKITDVGGEVRESDKHRTRKIELQTGECDNLLLYLYIIPHTLPEDNEIKDDPFPVKIRASYAGKEMKTTTKSINRWSGASLELRFSRE